MKKKKVKEKRKNLFLKYSISNIGKNNYFLNIILVMVFSKILYFYGKYF